MNKSFCLKTAYRPTALHYLLRGISTTGNKKGSPGRNHYEVLGIKQNASADVIREAFIKLSKECHPDMNSHDPKTHEKFIQVNEAYTVLSKGLSRRDYDLTLQARQAATRHPHRSSTSFESGYKYYHDTARSEFHDPFIFSMRDKSQDKYYENQPYYGVQGLSKVSNSKIVMTCFGIIAAGIVLHYFAVRKSSSLHIETLNERDVKTHKLWLDANNPTLFNQRLQSLREKRKEQEAKISKE